MRYEFIFYDTHVSCFLCNVLTEKEKKLEKNKVIAFYLPQFHEIPENNQWWGEGFTEWVNVKKADSLFEGHCQPRIPLNNNYYDLSDVNVMRWQAELAKDAGLFGFCFYHYWFYEKPLLEKPILNYLAETNIDFPYCICWANESWTNGWARSEASVIMEQKYGDKVEWRRHFEFLLPFFKDDRYIKDGDKPLLVIYRPYLCKEMIEMLDFWDRLAVENGLAGITVASQRFEQAEKYQDLYDRLDYHIEYQPGFIRGKVETKKTLTKSIRQIGHDLIYQIFNKDISFHQQKNGPQRVSYDSVWESILEYSPQDEKAIAGGFVDWDNTPRHSRRGTVFTGTTPEKFGNYMKRQLRHIHREYKNNYLFLFAWNEWGEGGYLEPDEQSKTAYLDALRGAIMTSED